MECLATFETTHMALLFEKSFRARGFEVRIVPVPRRISASCGLACSYPCETEDEVKRLAAEKHIEVETYHHLNNL